MAAKIRINSELTAVEFETPEGEIFLSEELGDDGHLDALDYYTVLIKPGLPAYLGVAGDFEGLKSNTLYKLVEVKTELEEGADIELDDEDDEDGEEEDEEDEAEEVPAA